MEWIWDGEITRMEQNLDWNNTEQIQSLDALQERRDEAGNYWPVLNFIFLFNFGHNFYIMLITGPKYR